MRFIPILCILQLCMAVDPWNVNYKGKLIETFDETSCETKQAKNVQECAVNETFYKRILQLIIRSGHLHENDGVTKTSLAFEFSKSDFELLEKFLSDSTPLTAEQLRKIDGLLFEHIVKVSFAKRLAEDLTATIFTWLINNYWMLLGGVAFILCSYKLYHFNWSKIPLKLTVSTVIFVIVYAWEVKIGIEKADHEDYMEFVNANSGCWMNIFGKECSQTRTAVSRFWEHIHPLKILSNIFTKLIFNSVTLCLHEMQDFFKIVSGQMPFGLDKLVYVTLNIFAVVLFIFLAISLISNVILNKPLSLSFLGLGLNLKQSGEKGSRRITSNNSNITDTLSGENLQTFLSIMKEANKDSQKKDKSPQYNGDRGQFLKVLEAHRKKGTDVVNDGSDKRMLIHRRTSSMPHGMNRLGAGDRV